MRWLSIVGLLLAGCGGGPECDAERLSADLAAAQSGDVVQVGPCRIAGNFTLPAGVALEGEAGSVIVGRIDLSGGGRVEGLAIESIDAGLVAQDGGAVVVNDVQITASTGIGMAANGVASLELLRVTLRGPIDATNVVMLQGTEPSPLQTATHGLILENVAAAALNDVSTHGFARFGALLKNSTTLWNQGEVSENAWVGIMVAGGNAALQGVRIHDTFDLELTDASTFGVVTSSAAIQTTQLTVDDSAGFGVFHRGGSAIHTELSASGNGYGACRLEVTSMAEISGELTANEFGAIIAYGASNVSIHDTTIRDTAQAMRAGANQGLIEAGDGIQLVDSHAGSRIENTTIEGNERVGVLIDLFGDNLGAGLFDNVTVSRTALTSNGVLVQGGTRDVDWADGLARDAATISVDDAFAGRLATVGAVGPCFLPRAQ